MANFNQVILAGNLTRDIELRYTPNGTAVADAGLAINRVFKDVKETTFVDITLWGKTAEVAAEYLTKGSSVLIVGRLQLDTWEKDGEKRSKMKVVCERMEMLSPKGYKGTGDGNAPTDQVNDPTPEVTGEDIPF